MVIWKDKKFSIEFASLSEIVKLTSRVYMSLNGTTHIKHLCKKQPAIDV